MVIVIGEGDAFENIAVGDDEQGLLEVREGSVFARQAFLLGVDRVDGGGGREARAVRPVPWVPTRLPHLACVISPTMQFVEIQLKLTSIERIGKTIILDELSNYSGTLFPPKNLTKFVQKKVHAKKRALSANKVVRHGF